MNLREKKRTTIPDQGARVFDDLAGRDFTAEACNQLYIGDFFCRGRQKEGTIHR